MRKTTTGWRDCAGSKTKFLKENVWPLVGMHPHFNSHHADQKYIDILSAEHFHIFHDHILLLCYFYECTRKKYEHPVLIDPSSKCRLGSFFLFATISYRKKHIARQYIIVQISHSVNYQLPLNHCFHPPSDSLFKHTVQ